MKQKPSIRSRLCIGTSGWYYMHWLGNFYPSDLKKEGFLKHYIRHFKTVELNGTFYHLPQASTARAWYNAVPSDFIFAVKANRFLTHQKKLKEAKEPLNRFLRWADLLKEKLGPILFQLPPHWRMNHDRLETFLKLLPKKYTCVFEFRDSTWFCEEVYQLLRTYDVGFCLYDMRGQTTPWIVTSSTVYVRFHGSKPRYRGDYSERVLGQWADRIRKWLAEQKNVFVYFNNDPEGHAPKNAQQLIRMLSAG